MTHTLLKANVYRASILLLALILISLNLRPALTSVAPVIQSIVEDLSLSQANAGLITTIPVLLMGLLAPLAPRLAARWSQESVLKGAMAVLTVALLLRHFSQHSFALLLLSAVLAGTAIAIAGPLMSGFIKQHFARHMGFAIAIYSVSITIGAALAVALTLPIISTFGGEWHYGLSSWGWLALATFLLLIIFLPKSTSPKLDKSILKKLPLHSFKAWLLTGFFAAQAGVFYALATWMVAHFEHVDFSISRASIMASVFMGSGILGALIMPLIAARTAKRSLLIAAVTFITTLLILAITWLPQFNPLVLVSILGVTTSGTFALALALPVLETDTPHEASQLSSMMSSFGYIIGGVTPALVGIGKDITGSYEWSFTFLAALSFCMVVIALFLPNVSKNHAT